MVRFWAKLKATLEGAGLGGEGIWSHTPEPGRGHPREHGRRPQIRQGCPLKRHRLREGLWAECRSPRPRHGDLEALASEARSMAPCHPCAPVWPLRPGVWLEPLRGGAEMPRCWGPL